MTKTNKVFVVMQTHYEYNDEGFDRNEGGNVVIAYSEQAPAEEEALQLTVDQVRRMEDAEELAGYIGWNCVDTLARFKPLARAKKIEDLEAVFAFDEETMLAFAKFLGGTFYYVVETELA